MSKSRKPSLSGFTIIELAIVLMIIGIITGAIFKGQDLLEAAKLRSILNDFNKIKIALVQYQETFGPLPGDDPLATSRFGATIPNGNGNGVIDPAEEPNLWQHLYKAGFQPSDKAPNSKIGGRYSIVYQPHDKLPGHWIQLGKENGAGANGGLLTPKQVQILKSKADGNGAALSPFEGSIRAMEVASISKGQCIQGEELNLNINVPSCIILTSID